MAAGTTRKPCHGCGQPKLRRTDGVCDDCARALEAGRAALAKASDWEAVEVPAAPWHLVADVVPGHGERVEAATYKLLLAISRLRFAPAPDVWKVGSGRDLQRPGCYGGRDWHGNRELPPGALAALRELAKAVDAEINKVRSSSLREGRSILHGLANGTLSPADFVRRGGGNAADE